MKRLVVCPIQCMTLDRIRSLECLSVCLYVCLSVRNTYRPRSFRPLIWTVYTSDNEDQLRWPITTVVVNAHARQFTSGLAHFYVCVHESLPFLVRFLSNLVLLHSLHSLCQGQEQSLSVAQPEVIYAHARNLTSGFYQFVQNGLKPWFTGEMFASCRKLRSLNPFPVTNLLPEV